MDTFLSGLVAIILIIILFAILMKISSKYCSRVGYYGLGSLRSPLISINNSVHTSSRPNSYTMLDDNFKPQQITIDIEKNNNSGLICITETGNPKVRSDSI